nr:RNA-directed DNA polymerase, eukaryota [Tanacetum cinerariifolium]
MFPRVYALESCKNITIADKVRQENPYQTFRRIPRGGVEQEQFQHVDCISRSVKLNLNNDSWTWSLEKSGMFSVASVRKMIDDTLIHSSNLNYRWNKYVSIKVNILVWKILNNSLPTKFNISRRGILIDFIICPNCDVRVETVGHLFFSCSMSRDIFNLIACWWKVSIENFDCYDEWLEWIDSIRMSKKTKIMMEAVFYTSWWMIWWFRNSKIFKEKAPKKACFFDELQSGPNRLARANRPTGENRSDGENRSARENGSANGSDEANRSVGTVVSISIGVGESNEVGELSRGQAVEPRWVNDKSHDHMVSMVKSHGENVESHPHNEKLWSKITPPNRGNTFRVYNASDPVFLLTQTPSTRSASTSHPQVKKSIRMTGALQRGHPRDNIRATPSGISESVVGTSTGREDAGATPAVVTPFATREQIEGHLSALKSLLTEQNSRNNLSLIRLNFDDVEDQTIIRTVVMGKEIADVDLKKPFKEAVKTPLTRRIIEFSGLEFKMSTNIKLYDGTIDPEDHISRFSSAANSGEWPMLVWCRMFQQTLDRSVRSWFENLLTGSIDGWTELRQQFTTRFLTRRACFKDPTKITQIMRKANETLVAFKEKWTVKTGFIVEVPEVMKISSFMDAHKCLEGMF